MNAKNGMSVEEARVMALGYALVEAFHLLENGDSIEIIKTGGKAVAIGEPDVELVAYLLNYKED